jgi:hypothetical protein
MYTKAIVLANLFTNFFVEKTGRGIQPAGCMPLPVNKIVAGGCHRQRLFYIRLQKSAA